MTLAEETRANTARIIADFLAKGERYRGADWCGVRPADVTMAAKIMQAQDDRIAACTCQPAAGFDLTAHLSEPSRLNPLAAAAAVNMGRAVL